MNFWMKRNKKGRETWPTGLAMFLLCLLAALSGCARTGGSKSAAQESAENTEKEKNGEAAEAAGADHGSAGEEKLTVVTTLFPYYDFTRQTAGDLVELSMVIPAGMDSHSFEPTPADIRLLQSADVLICNGGTMEQWVRQVLDSIDTSRMTVVTMMDYVDVVEEEIVEGMEAEEEDGHEHEHGHDYDHDSGSGDDRESGGGLEAEDGGEEEFEMEYDEHIWTSPVNAMAITEVIADTLKERDPAHADGYEAGKTAYLEKLAELDAQFRQIRAEADTDLFVMGDKFPLRYFADTYGLRYRAAFTGCSTDTEPSARTIAYLIDIVREEELPAVYYLELSSPRVAEIISEETGAKPLLFHSCHNVTRREFDSGVTYYDLMKQNAENLREGLCR